MGITLLFLDEQVLFHLFTIKLFEKDQPFDSVNFISSVLVTFFFLRILWSMGLYLPLAPVTTVQVYEVVPSSKFQALRLLDALTCTRSQKVHSWSGSCHKQPLMKSWSMLPLSTSKNSCSGSLSIFKHLLTRTWNSQVYFLYIILEIILFSLKIVLIMVWGWDSICVSRCRCCRHDSFRPRFRSFGRYSDDSICCPLRHRTVS